MCHLPYFGRLLKLSVSAQTVPGMMSTKIPVLLCYLAILASHIQIQAQQPCTAPNGKAGQCRDIHRCPHLLEIISSHRVTPDRLQYLRQAQCGFNGLNPKVCCAGVESNRRSPSEKLQRRPGISPSRDQHPNIRVLPLAECGISEDMKIFGGSETGLDEFPWTARLQYQSRRGPPFYGCGGSLISSRYVLTAAHCTSKELFKRIGNSTIIVRLGEHNVETDPDCEESPTGEPICADSPRDYHVETQIPHPDYNSVTNFHDIALLRLDRTVTPFSEYIKPICLPVAPELASKSYQGKFLTVTGWGATEKAKSSPVKLKVNVPVVDMATCQRSYDRNLVTIGPGQICAGGQAGKDSCLGDSGGPLMSVENQRYHVIGLTSFGPKGECARQGWPGVYTRVAHYSAWILDELVP